MIKNYEQLFPIITEAMKEQQNQIEQLQQENAEIKRLLYELLDKN